MDFTPIMLTIEQAHIDKGIPMNSHACPVRLALDDALNLPPQSRPHSHPIRVTAHYVTYKVNDLDYAGGFKYNSKRLEEFVNRVDEGKFVKPGTFRVYVPKAWIKD